MLLSLLFLTFAMKIAGSGAAVADEALQTAERQEKKTKEKTRPRPFSII